MEAFLVNNNNILSLLHFKEKWVSKLELVCSSSITSSIDASVKSTLTDFYDDNSIRFLQFQYKIKNVDEQLKSYLLYENEWDGYLARSFHPDLIAYFQQILSLINKFSAFKYIDEISTTPSSDGAINLELIKGKKELIIRKYFDENKIEYYSYDGQNSKTESYSTHSNFLAEKLNWLNG